MPRLDDIVANRIRQQRDLDRRSGRSGMTPDQVRRFVHYFYQDAWEPGFSSPVPPESRVTFWAAMDEHYRVLRLRRGGRL